MTRNSMCDFPVHTPILLEPLRHHGRKVSRCVHMVAAKWEPLHEIVLQSGFPIAALLATWCLRQIVPPMDKQELARKDMITGRRGRIHKTVDAGLAPKLQLNRPVRSLHRCLVTKRSPDGASSPDGAQRNPVLCPSRPHIPDFASLHPGYALPPPRSAPGTDGLCSSLILSSWPCLTRPSFCPPRRCRKGCAGHARA